jgi:hypothetical protein
MYKQGLGDCFLLTFPRNPKPFHMLIDCGALKSKHYDAELMKNVVRDIQMRTDNHLDVVIATHEHWDHISGFTDAREEFDAIEFEQVWVAWTENPQSEAAKILKKEFKKGLKALAAALEKMPPEKKGKHLSLYKTAIGNLMEFSGGLGVGKTTADAWQYILKKAPNTYCDPKKAPLTLNGVEGVRVYVLGPPEDPNYVRKLLSKAETYHGPLLAPFAGFLAAAGADEEDERVRALPFAESLGVSPVEAKQRKFFQEHYGFSDDDEGEWRRIDNDWLNIAGELALHLDNYTNNVCLALAIELGDSGKVLLFPGDAQVGNWLSWGDLKWTVKNEDGEKREVTAADLLARTVFYKVGHHGSHNATLRAKGLELMGSSDLVAAIPVHRKTAKDQNWAFPYPPLWNRLKEKARGRVLLADAGDLNEVEKEAQEVLTSTEWKNFKGATSFDTLCVQYDLGF